MFSKVYSTLFLKDFSLQMLEESPARGYMQPNTARADVKRDAERLSPMLDDALTKHRACAKFKKIRACP